MKREDFIHRIRFKPEIATLEELPCGDCGKPATLVYSEASDSFVVEHEDCEIDEDHKFNPASSY